MTLSAFEGSLDSARDDIACAWRAYECCSALNVRWPQHGAKQIRCVTTLKLFLQLDVPETPEIVVGGERVVSEVAEEETGRRWRILVRAKPRRTGYEIFADNPALAPDQTSGLSACFHPKPCRSREPKCGSHRDTGVPAAPLHLPLARPAYIYR